jgi:hypothetical protein
MYARTTARGSARRPDRRAHRAEAREHSRESLELARQLRNPFALAWAGFFTAALHVFLREPGRALEHTDPLIALCTKHQFPLFVGLITIVRGAAISEDGRHEEGVGELRRGIDAYRATGQRVSHRLYLSWLAEACTRAGAVDQATATVQEALGMPTDERLFEPELHRLRAELLARQGAEATGVESCFRAAIDLARCQSARSLELRATTSYARCCASPRVPMRRGGISARRAVGSRPRSTHAISPRRGPCSASCPAEPR